MVKRGRTEGVRRGIHQRMPNGCQVLGDNRREDCIGGRLSIRPMAGNLSPAIGARGLTSFGENHRDGWSCLDFSPRRKRGQGIGIRARIHSCGYASTMSVSTGFSNRVYAFRKTRGIVPMGPLRCLEMMISALPLLGLFSSLL